jgi:hypothetical protein
MRVRGLPNHTINTWLEAQIDKRGGLAYCVIFIAAVTKSLEPKTLIHCSVQSALRQSRWQRLTIVEGNEAGSKVKELIRRESALATIVIARLRPQRKDVVAP